MKKILFSMAVMLAIMCSCNKNKAEQAQASEPVAQDTIKPANAEQAKETRLNRHRQSKLPPNLPMRA